MVPGYHGLEPWRQVSTYSGMKAHGATRWSEQALMNLFWSQQPGKLSLLVLYIFPSVDLKFYASQRGGGHALVFAGKPRDHLFESRVVSDQHRAVAGIRQQPDQPHQVGGHGSIDGIIE